MSSVAALTPGSEDVTRADGVKARRPIMTLPRSMQLTPQCFRSIKSRIEQLHAALAERDIDRSMAAVTVVVQNCATRRMDAPGATAKAQGYAIALDDLPPWAVEAACRAYLRAECGPDRDYQFAPAGPVLREIALKSVARVEIQLSRLQSLLEAKIVDDPPVYDEAHRATMIRRLCELSGLLSDCLTAQHRKAVADRHEHEAAYRGKITALGVSPAP